MCSPTSKLHTGSTHDCLFVTASQERFQQGGSTSGVVLLWKFNQQPQYTLCWLHIIRCAASHACERVQLSLRLQWQQVCIETPYLSEVIVFGRQGAHFTYEVIVVNDGSVDGTSAVAFNFIRRFGFDAVRLLQLPQNCGKVRLRMEV